MMIRRVHLGTVLLTLGLTTPMVRGQSNAAPQPDATSSRLEVMSKLLLDTQHQLEQTQQQLNQMRLELEELRGHAAAKATAPLAPASTGAEASSSSAESVAEQVRRQQEEQEILQSEVKQHDQTKLESVSKYPVRVYGLMLFNTFSNAGVVDNADLPSIAIARKPEESHGSVGASFRQTLFGLTANGPKLFGARTSADVSIDFFGGPSYSYYGATNGSVRLRRGDIGLAWGTTSDPEGSHDELHLGVDAPLISPLSPTSFATVATPALAWSGNLWTWSPQLRYKHTFSLAPDRGQHSIQLEGGLWDPPVVGATGDSAGRVLSAGELSRRPGFLGRASYHAGSAEHPLALGVGGYSDRQTYYEGQQIQMWAVTADWQIPLTRWFELQGELYRGRGLGGLGGGAYKDVLTGTDIRTGADRTMGLNAVGGWAQLKARLFQGTEANFIFGQDGGFASDYRQLDLTSNTYYLETSARNHMMVGNLVYRPKTYLIVSPEYRRILSWNITGPVSKANVYTLSLGYQF